MFFADEDCAIQSKTTRLQKFDAFRLEFIFSSLITKVKKRIRVDFLLSRLFEAWRIMHGYIREFNRLKPHSSHDLVFKIWRNNKTEATLRVFVYDCELLVTNSQWVPPKNMIFKAVALKLSAIQVSV